MDPLSLSASIAGLISITDMIAGRSYKYIKEARGASKEVKKLLEEITDLFGILNSLRLVAARYQDEAFDSTMQSQHIHTCHKLLEKIKDRLDKADPNQVDETKSPLRQKASTLGRTLVWPFSSAETKGLIAEVANQKSTLSLALAADGMNTLIENLSHQKAQGEDIAEIRENIRAQRAEQTLTLLSNERKRMLDTIGPFDPSSHQNVAIKLRQPGTGVWFTEGHQFKHWLATSNAKLWLYGIPGAGKTVLASSIIQAASNQTEHANGLAYFYCDYKDPKTHDPMVILGALVRQLALQNPRCLGAVEKFYSNHYRESGPTTGPSVAPEDFCLLIQSLSTFFDEVMIIIDALDECGNDRSKVVELLAILNADGFNIKTLFTSRLETDIEVHLQYYEKISIAATSSDLKLYVASEIESRSRKRLLRTRDPDLKKEIMDRLVDGAEGMFRWVACQLDYLCELNTDKAIRRGLNSLPPTLFATYERILDRVNASSSDTQKLVQRVLTWIVCSEEPLSTKELLQAVSISEGDTKLDHDAMPDEEGILKWCSSLVRRTPDGDRLELAHFTVEEFLLAIDGSGPRSPYARYKIFPGKENLPLAKLCLTYLLFEDFREIEWTGIEQREEFFNEYSFYRYCSTYWIDHSLAHRADEGLLDLVEILFDPSKTGNFICWSRYWTQNNIMDNEVDLSNTETLHFAAALSFYHICKWLIEEKGRISDLDKLSTIGTPLFCAITGEDLFVTSQVAPSRYAASYADEKKKIYDGNRRATIECLLDAGVKTKNIRIHPQFQWTPLSLSIRTRFGWDVLLQSGVILDDASLEEVEALINRSNSFAESFLLKVSDKNLDEHIHSKYVNLAFRMDCTRQQAASIMARNNGLSKDVSFDSSSALSKAATVGQTRVVRELLQQPGINIHWQDPDSENRTALHHACHNGHLEVVKLLVEHGASIEATDDKGMTPILEAAGLECLDVVRFLEENGSDINAVAEDGRTILHISAIYNSVPDLEHFLQSPKLTHSLTTRTKNGRAVLLCAVEAGSVEATRFILQRSSRLEILSKTNDGYNCLHYAVRSGEVRLLPLFDNSGICHYDQTSEGFAAIHFAAKSRDSRLLLKILDYIDRTTDGNRNPFSYPTLIEPRSPVQCVNGTWSVDDFICGRRLNIPTSSGTLARTAIQIILSADPFSSSQADMVEDIVCRTGIDLERRDKEQKTPLVFLASRLSNEIENSNICEAIEYLLHEGVDRNTQDIFGRTALHYLCDPESFSEEIFEAISDLIGEETPLIDRISQACASPPAPLHVKSRGRRPVVLQSSGTVIFEKCLGRGSPYSSSSPSPSPPLTPILRPTGLNFSSTTARVDISDKSRTTPLQAFFASLDRTHNSIQATEIAIRMLKLSPKNELNRQSPDGNRLLNLAIKFKNDKLIQELCNGGHINTQERDSTAECRSPLELFCIHGVRDVEILRSLLKACKDICEFDHKGLSLLHIAANAGHVKVVKELLDGGMNVNIKCREGLPALCYAVNRGHTSIVEFLLDNGATTEGCGPANKHWLASLLSCARNVAICRILDDRGINDWTERSQSSFGIPYVPHLAVYSNRENDTRNSWSSRVVHQMTPLHTIAWRGKLDVFKYIVEYVKDVDINVEAEFGIRPLYFAILAESTSMVKYMLEQGATTDGIYEPTGWTMLHLAAHLGNYSIVMSLLKHGADPCATDSSSLTPSIIALQQHHLDIFDDLEEAEKTKSTFTKGKSTSSQNEKISPALTDAISNGDIKLCQQLIERGFAIDGICECGCTVLVKACLKNQWAIASYLLQLGAPLKGVACAKEYSFEGLSAFQLVALNGEFELFEKMFNQDPPTPEESEEKTQAFYLAASRGHVNILRFLLEHAEEKRPLLEARKRSSQNIENEIQFTNSGELEYIRPLHFAVYNGKVKAAEILLRAGADIEARDETGLTALQVANMAGPNRPIIDLLIKAGANLNTRDFNGMTPLMHAATKLHGLKNVKRLVSFAKGGLDSHATDRGGSTALRHAIDSKNLDAAKFLIDAGLDPLQGDNFGCSPIQRALQLDLTQFTLENLPEVDEVRSPAQGSILNTAALMGNEAAFTELLKRVPEKDQVEYVNLSCDLGTPLYCGAYNMGISIIEKLLEKGAQVNLVGGPAGSPLMAACANGHVEAVRILLKKGAELQCTKFDGTTITAEEAAQHHESVLLLLRRYKEKGAGALDEKIPVKTADISELDKFMVAYKERKEKKLRQRVLDGKDQANLSGDESDDWKETTGISIHDENDQQDDLEHHKKDVEKGRDGSIETTEDDAKLKTVIEKAETALAGKDD